jgi:hypothetical protein
VKDFAAAMAQPEQPDVPVGSKTVIVECQCRGEEQNGSSGFVLIGAFMTKGDRKSRGVKSSSSDTKLPWRPFYDRPTGIWIDETVARIKETAQPELIESLYRNPIPKDARFRVLKHLITVDGTKRPEGDNCPCPMCTPNRFLTGSPVWFLDLQCCAFIGNCCANDGVLAEAEKERKWREKRDSEESYLLEALPLVGPKLTVLETLKPVAFEAVRAYRKIRNKLPTVHEQLRKMSSAALWLKGVPSPRSTYIASQWSPQQNCRLTV